MQPKFPATIHWVTKTKGEKKETGNKQSCLSNGQVEKNRDGSDFKRCKLGLGRLAVVDCHTTVN